MPIINLEQGTKEGTLISTTANAYKLTVLEKIKELYHNLAGPWHPRSSHSFSALWEDVLKNVSASVKDDDRFISHRSHYQALRKKPSADLPELMSFPYVDPENIPPALLEKASDEKVHRYLTEMTSRKAFREYLSSINNPSSYEKAKFAELQQLSQSSSHTEVHTLKTEVISYVTELKKIASNYTVELEAVIAELQQSSTMPLYRKTLTAFQKAYAIRAISSVKAIETVAPASVQHFAALLEDALYMPSSPLQHHYTQLVLFCPHPFLSSEENEKLTAILSGVNSVKILQDKLPWPRSKKLVQDVNEGDYLLEATPTCAKYSGSVFMVKKVGKRGELKTLSLHRQKYSDVPGEMFETVMLEDKKTGKVCAASETYEFKTRHEVNELRKCQRQDEQFLISLLNQSRLSTEDKIAICSILPTDLNDHVIELLFSSDEANLINALEAYLQSDEISITEIGQLLEKDDFHPLNEQPIFKNIFNFIQKDDEQLEHKQLALKLAIEEVCLTESVEEVLHTYLLRYFIPAIEKTIRQWDAAHQKDELVINTSTTSIGFQVILLLTTLPHRSPRNTEKIYKSSVPVSTSAIKPEEERILSQNISPEVSDAVRELLKVCDLSLTTTHGRDILISLLSRIGLENTTLIQTKFVGARCEAFSLFAEDRIPATFRNRKSFTPGDESIDDNLKELIKITLGNRLPYNEIFSFDPEQYPMLFKALEEAIFDTLKEAQTILSSPPPGSSLRGPHLIGGERQTRYILAELSFIPADIIRKLYPPHSDIGRVLSPFIEVLSAPSHNPNMSRKKFFNLSDFGAIGDINVRALEIMKKNGCNLPKPALAPNYTALKRLSEIPPIQCSASSGAFTALRAILNKRTQNIRIHSDLKKHPFVHSFKESYNNPEQIPEALRNSDGFEEIWKSICGLGITFREVNDAYFPFIDALSHAEQYAPEDPVELQTYTPLELASNALSWISSLFFRTPQPHPPSKQQALSHNAIQIAQLQHVNDVTVLRRGQETSPSWLSLKSLRRGSYTD